MCVFSRNIFIRLDAVNSTVVLHAIMTKEKALNRTLTSRVNDYRRTLKEFSWEGTDLVISKSVKL